MLRVGMIGSGFIGKVHAAAYQKEEGVVLAALADINEDAGRTMAGEFGCSWYQDAEQMILSEEIDVVDICVPSFLHERFVEMAARHHKHILCEKPFGLSYASCERMKTCCEEAGVKLMVAQASRWIPAFSRIKDLLEQGVLGSLHLVSGRRLSQAPGWTKWHKDPGKSGGGLYDLHVHNIDYLISLFGEVASVYAIGWKTESGCWDHIMTSFSFTNGVKAVDEASLSMTGDYPFSFGMRLAGEKATLEYSFSGGVNIEECPTAVNSFILYPKDGMPSSVFTDEADPYEREIHDFTDAIRKGLPVPIDPEESLYVMKVVEGIQKSLETGEVIRI